MYVPKCDRQTTEIHVLICERFEAYYAAHGYTLPGDRVSRLMDLAAVAEHSTVDWVTLLAANDGNFLHDVGGIHRHIDRTTGELTDHFSPRFTR